MYDIGTIVPRYEAVRKNYGMVREIYGEVRAVTVLYGIVQYGAVRFGMNGYGELFAVLLFS